MKPVNQEGCKILDKLTEGLTEENSHRKIDNNKPGSSIMAVTVEYIGDCNLGPKFSVAHYYEQNGDLMRDPEMVFVKAKMDSRYYPIMYQQDNLGIYRESVRFDEHGEAEAYLPREQADEAVFAGIWMRNIKAQQRL
ncbi:MAG: hypothetical protein PHV74_00325 [Dehalococcoidia bacterium]|nr:hypothetical protein [Dehalococcoidia bacterium]